MRALVSLVAIAALIFTATPAQAGPLDLPPTPPTPAIPTSGPGVAELLQQLEGEIQGFIDEAPDGDPGAVLDPVYHFLAAWADRVKDLPDCVEPDLYMNGGSMTNPPSVQSGNGEGYSWIRVNVGSTSIQLTMDDGCLSPSSQQSNQSPWP